MDSLGGEDLPAADADAKAAAANDIHAQMHRVAESRMPFGF